MKRNKFYLQREVIALPARISDSFNGPARQPDLLIIHSAFNHFINSQPVNFSTPAGSSLYTETFLTLNCQNEVYEKDCPSGITAPHGQVDVSANTVLRSVADPAAYASAAGECSKHNRSW